MGLYLPLSTKTENGYSIGSTWLKHSGEVFPQHSSTGEAVSKERTVMSMAELKKDTKTAARKDEERLVAELDKLLASFAGEKSELIPILQRVQREFGYLTVREITDDDN
jgi:hypothetical protein